MASTILPLHKELPKCPFKLQIHSSSCLLGIFPWMVNQHLTFNMSNSKFITSPVLYSSSSGSGLHSLLLHSLLTFITRIYLRDAGHFSPSFSNLTTSVKALLTSCLDFYTSLLLTIPLPPQRSIFLQGSPNTSFLRHRPSLSSTEYLHSSPHVLRSSPWAT